MKRRPAQTNRYGVKSFSFRACGEKATSSNKQVWCEVIDLAKSKNYFPLELSNRPDALDFLENW